MGLRIHLSRHGRSELLELLRENGVEFTKRYPPIGTIVAAGEFIEIVGVLGPPIALALGKWLGRRDGRRLTFTLKNHEIQHFDARGYSADKVSKLLTEAAWIAAIQPEVDDHK